MIAFHPFRPRLLDDLKSYRRADFIHDLTAGLTVGVVALPLAMAFAIASGLQPAAGLYTAIVAGFVISAFGGSKVQIGGPAGAFIVVVYGIVERYGLANLIVSTMLAGMLLFALGWLRLGGLVRYIPVSIVLGFTNGIAVLIALSELRDFFGLQVGKMPDNVFMQLVVLARHADTFNPWSVVIGVTGLLALLAWPKLFRPDKPVTNRVLRAAARVPSPIIVLVVATVAASFFHLPVETLGTRFGGIPTALPQFVWPGMSLSAARQLVIPTITIALLGAIESLLCARVADTMIEGPRHDPNQELMAQGLANFLSPLFGGMPATGTIARTVTNIRAGARSPIAGMVHAVVVLAVLLVAAPWAAYVPLAALAAILLFVAWNMGEWREFGRLMRYKLTYRTIFLGSFALTVLVDLTTAVEVGLILSCVFFIYRISTLTRVESVPLPAEDDAAGIRAVRLYGVLFFGAVTKVEALEDTVDDSHRVLVIDAAQLINLDTSGLEALQSLHASLRKRGAALLLAGLHDQPRSLIERSGFAGELGAQALADTLAEALAHARTISRERALA
ncbi:MAG: STAS domain-containing protein [Betaproteobacteria bacterium]|nr:STAS domain-containing protein [Betaproteobacteria bacterium]